MSTTRGSEKRELPYNILIVQHLRRIHRFGFTTRANHVRKTERISRDDANEISRQISVMYDV